jgi:hypothetical protein
MCLYYIYIFGNVCLYYIYMLYIILNIYKFILYLKNIKILFNKDQKQKENNKN